MAKTERKLFEEWYEADAMPLETYWFERMNDGEYKLLCVEHAWHGWLGRARLAFDQQTAQEG